jgi:hypothetical protein
MSNDLLPGEFHLQMLKAIADQFSAEERIASLWMRYGDRATYARLLTRQQRLAVQSVTKMHEAQT